MACVFKLFSPFRLKTFCLFCLTFREEKCHNFIFIREKEHTKSPAGVKCIQVEDLFLVNYSSKNTYISTKEIRFELGLIKTACF